MVTATARPKAKSGAKAKAKAVAKVAAAPKAVAKNKRKPRLCLVATKGVRRGQHPTRTIPITRAARAARTAPHLVPTHLSQIRRPLLQNVALSGAASADISPAGAGNAVILHIMPGDMLSGRRAQPLFQAGQPLRPASGRES